VAAATTAFVEESRCDADEMRSSRSTSTSWRGETAKEFRNVGAETWTEVRKAWRQPSSNPGRLPPYPSKSLRREIRKGITAERQFELRRNVALEDMIEIYTEVWNEDSD